MLTSLAFSAPLFANEDVVLQAPDIEFVLETYEYCLTLQDNENIDNASLLACINTELEYYDYTGFSSLEQVKSFANIPKIKTR